MCSNAVDESSQTEPRTLDTQILADYSTVVLGGVPRGMRDCERAACWYGAMHANRGGGRGYLLFTIEPCCSTKEPPIRQSRFRQVMLVLGIDLCFPASQPASQPTACASVHSGIYSRVHETAMFDTESRCILRLPFCFRLAQYILCAGWGEGEDEGARTRDTGNR